MNRLDPISLEIISNALRSITDETYAALMKSAYSTNIKERHDHSTAIMDRSGRLVAQAVESLPIHIASMHGLMQALLDKFGDNIHPGDLFIANDPHAAGGTHLPDVNLAMPIFIGLAVCQKSIKKDFEYPSFVCFATANCSRICSI